MGNITASLKEAAPGKESNGIHCGCYSALIVADPLIKAKMIVVKLIGE